MLTILRLLTRAAEAILALPARICGGLIVNVAYNPKLGALRYVFLAVIAYVAFSVALVYVVAPIRGMVGAAYLADKLHYDAERWVATAMYDVRGDFVGTFDPRLDSQRDVNFTDTAIEVAGYVANPDHKSIPVQDVPEDYWKCLLYHEDRHLGGWRNPFGIDLVGVLKIPFSSIARTIRTGRPNLGVGGSTLPMQFVRVIYKTPPRGDESPWEKLGRKVQEWWLAPVIYQVLTRDGDMTPLKQWAANHLWLAQRTAGSPLHGVAVTSQIVFGKDAKDLTRAEQYVLASAVNKPIILLPGSDRLNRVRLDRWRYIAEVRASKCAGELIADAEEQKKVVLELVEMASGPPDPKVRPRLQLALETFAPDFARRAEANPRLRANALFPDVRYGAREEMKQAFGFNWRAQVRGLTTTVDAGENLAFRDRMVRKLQAIDKQWSGRLKPGYTLDPVRGGNGVTMPDVVVVAADRNNRIVRYYESNDTAAYFGSAPARDPATGKYDPSHEGRAIASTGKMLAAIAIANSGRDSLASEYLDTAAPASGLETCRRGGTLRRNRTAEVSFACSLNTPLEWRAARAGQERMGALISAFGFNPPPANADGEPTPPSTAAVRGYIGGSAQRVHQMSSVILAALTGRGQLPVTLPSLVETYNFTTDDARAQLEHSRSSAIVPDDVIKRGSHGLLQALLESPLCYRVNGGSQGTLKDLANWCAQTRPDLRLHFAKTGTQVNVDPDETVDVWASGGLQFANGAAYSYVVLVGTGTPNQPFGRSLHSSQVAAPLVAELLSDLAEHARDNPAPVATSSARRSTQHDARATLPARGTGADNKPAKSAEFSVRSLFDRIVQR